MDELLLVDMMSEIDLSFIQNELIEKDMKRNFFRFPLKKRKKQVDNLEKFEKVVSKTEENENNYSFNVYAFEKKFWNLKKIMSGMVATTVIFVGILIVLKNDIKMVWNHL